VPSHVLGTKSQGKNDKKHNYTHSHDYIASQAVLKSPWSSNYSNC